ncbi:MAG: 50S ribosomal protein L15 [Deltaproteobacteria bacterium]|nr:50S ribosomal protein L15 [Deltaproteobacteria bacterium]
MNLSTLKKPEGMTTQRKRIGRGTGSGFGKTAGKGHKGHNARSGGGVKPDFEGGQMPLKRRMPKYGFVNTNRVQYQVINMKAFEIFSDNEEVSIEKMVEKGMIKGNKPVVILGNGDIHKKLVIYAHRFSQQAKQKIETAGGKAEVVSIVR